MSQTIISHERTEGVDPTAGPTKWVTHTWDINLPRGQKLCFRLTAHWEVILKVHYYKPDGKGWRELLFASPASKGWRKRLWAMADFVYDQIEVARFNKANRGLRDLGAGPDDGYWR